jgi:enoyl-CoA hydratase/carnithine racemase
MADAHFDTIEARAEGARGELILDQPERLNPLSLRTLHEIMEASEWLNAHPELKVVTVSGKGRASCAGADVSLIAGGGEGMKMSPRAAADAGRLMAEAVDSIKAVTIARIQGHCVGGGLVLASACDLRIAASDARFLIPEVDLGIPLGWGGLPRLIGSVGAAIAKEWVMTCRPISAQEARDAGFLNRVVDAEALDSAVEELATQLVDKPKLALLTTKRQANDLMAEILRMHETTGDADLIVSGLEDHEGREAALRYFQRLRERSAS